MSAKVDWLDKWDALYAERARASLALQAVPEGDNPEFEWLSGVFSGAMAPNPLLSVSDWSDDNINLPSKGAAEPGPYRTARAPYARDPMNDCGVLSSVETVILMWGAQLGKALAIDTPIPTPTGWKRMGDIRAGDIVFDERGAPTRVLVAHPIMTGHRCIEVEFSDGAKIVCDEEHLWSVCDPGDGRWRTLEARAAMSAHLAGARLYVPPVGRMMDAYRAALGINRRVWNFEHLSRRIVAMNYVDSVPVRCIGVDSPSHLFLCGREMIPTHNTQSLALNVVGYTMACNPGPILLVQPTVDAAKRFSQQRIQPMIEESKTLRAIVADTKSRDESNTMLLKSFMGGILILGGANSASALRSMPIATLVCDEISNYPLDVDGEGSPLALAKARTATFARRKIILTSTPATSGTCAVEAEYLNSDQRRYFVPCLQCGHMHTLDWANFVIPKDDQGNKLPEKAHMACPECGGVIEEHDKTLMLERGEWRATNPDYRDKKRRGYQLSSLYAPVGWRSWESVAREFLEAVGNPLKMKAFTNNVLGETFKDSGERRDPATLRGRAEEYGADGVLPDGVVLITAGIDLQMDRIEIQYVGWGRGEESWVLDHKILYGTPEGDDVWPLLDNAMRRQWVTGSGIALTVARGFMDTGGTGSVTARAYDYLKMRWGVMPIWGIKGQGGQGKPPVGSAAKTDSSKVPIYRLGVDALKESLYQRLTIEAPGPGFIHTPMSLPAGWYDQLVAEEIVTKHLKGFPVREWHKPSGKRNEALDTYVYAHAAMLSLALDLNAIADAIEGASTSQAPARRIRATMDA